MLKKIGIVLCSLFLCVSLAACSNHEAQPSQETETQENETIVLEDQAGREVVLDQPAEKIVSCYYITTYAALSLGLEDKLVGIESKADTRPIYQMAAPELLELPSVGTLKEFDVEGAIALEPDLVIMPQRLIEQADALEQVGIPVLVVYPESQELLEEMLVLIGKATGTEEKAQQLLDYYDQKLAELDTLLADVQTPSVYMAGNGSYLTAAGSQMYQSSMIELAKGVSASADIDSDYWSEVSYEDILVMNPDVIILPANAEYSAEDIYNDAQLQNIPAVVNQAVYQMPKDIEEWDSPIPSGICGIMWLASVLHEDVYSFEDMVQDVVDFYQTFYGFELDASLITK